MDDPRAPPITALRALLVIDGSAGTGIVERVLSEGTTRFDLRREESVGGAIARLASEAFDAVLLDLALPDADGATTVTAVQAAAPAAAIVVLAHSEDDGDALASVRAGAQDCLVRSCLWQGCGAASMLVRRALRHAVERKRSEQRIAFLAEHDPLTGLTNRSFFQSALEGALARARRQGDHVAVLFLDLDRFKSVNDRLGHEAGDQLLQEVARRLVGCLREQDTVARLGGDEFLVLIEGLRSADHATVVARSIRRALGRRFHLGGHRASCSASIGIALSPRGARIDPATLIARADAAMYRAKSTRVEFELANGTDPTVSQA